MRAEILIHVLLFIASTLSDANYLTRRSQRPFGKKSSEVGESSFATATTKLKQKTQSEKRNEDESEKKKQLDGASNDENGDNDTPKKNGLEKLLDLNSKYGKVGKYGAAFGGGALIGVTGMQLYGNLANMHSPDAGNLTQWNTSGITPLLEEPDLGLVKPSEPTNPGNPGAHPPTPPTSLTPPTPPTPPTPSPPSPPSPPPFRSVPDSLYKPGDPLRTLRR